MVGCSIITSLECMFNWTCIALINLSWPTLEMGKGECLFYKISFFFRYLIKEGANVAAVNNDGDLPIDICEDEIMEHMLQDEMSKLGIIILDLPGISVLHQSKEITKMTTKKELSWLELICSIIKFILFRYNTDRWSF